MVKASDLVKEQKERENHKKETYKKIFERIEKKITLASASNAYECNYEIPNFIIGLPLYSVKKCKKFVVKKLIENGFKVDSKENIVFISWKPQSNQ